MIPAIALALAAHAQQPPRYALVVGANDGGPGRPALRYAHSDADAFADVMTELGGIASDALVRLDQPTPGQLSSALRDLGERTRGTDDASIVVYYSGHSDVHGLLLDGARYPYAALRAELDAIDAELRIAVIDGCASGAMFRAKGGSVAPSFVGSAAEVSGHAFLSSSTADELSQEADHLGASYFTHALVTGLRGAADYDGDHRVTLLEARTFAAEETLSRTQTSQLGAQHPAYDIVLSGTGDVVLTDVRELRSALTLPEALRGRIYVWDEARHLVAELHKPPGRAIALGLPAGRYDVVVDRDGALLRGWVAVPNGVSAELIEALLIPTIASVTVARGQLVERVPLTAALLPIPTSRGLSSRDELHHAALGVVAVHGAQLRGLALGTVATAYDHGVDGAQLAFGLNRGGGVRGAQLTLGLNQARSVDGVQLGTLGASGSVRGLQLGAAVAAAGSVRGLQLAPVSVARSADVQLGLVNVAGEIRGLSLGLVAIARRPSGIHLALVPWISGGIRQLQLSSSTRLPVGGAVALGSRSLFTTYAGGVDPWRGLRGLSAGLGLRMRPGAWHLDASLHLGAWADPRGLTLGPQARLELARPLQGTRLAPFVGVGLGAARSDGAGAVRPEGSAGLRWSLPQAPDADVSPPR